MSPKILLHETAVRETGESPAIPLGADSDSNLLITLGITHAIEQESIDVDLMTSEDGKVWSLQPAVSFPRKFYCGTYQMILAQNSGRFIKAVWRVSRWGKDRSRPFFRVYLTSETARVRTMAGAAA